MKPRAAALRRGVGVVRLAVALTGIVALVARFVYGLDFITFTVANYFGYLTIQSNFAGVAIFLATGVHALRRRTESVALSTARMVVTCYLTVAGIVFALLATQATVHEYRLDVPWSDQLLHFWIPAYAIADWVFAPGRRPVSWRFSALVLGYPIVWGMVTMVRGAAVGWYPYFFLDPHQVQIGEFAGYNAAALATFAAVSSLLNLAARVVPPLGTPVSPPARRPARLREAPSRSR